MPKIYIIKQNGEREIFDFNKLKRSLINSGASKETAEIITDSVSNKIKDGMTTGAIYELAFRELGQKSNRIAARYSLRRALSDLGPSGFPFEQFMAEIFRSRGFEVMTNQFVKGHCAEHEIDLVIWNNDKLIMAEAKFHNQLGLKSDLKIALYIKARFDDIKGADLFYGKQRKLDEWILITNTKFTEKAVSFSECAGLNLIGWNYPKGNNLHDLIEESGLHPITCLKTLNQNEKRALIETGHVLCRRVGNPEVLKSFGFSDKRIDEILEEVNQVCLPFNKDNQK